MKYFVQHPKTGQMFYFNTLSDTIIFLEKLCKEILGLTRKEFMDNISSLGYGYYDDERGINFIRTLHTDYFNMGIVRKDGSHIKCDISTCEYFNKEEYGN